MFEACTGKAGGDISNLDVDGLKVLQDDIICQEVTTVILKSQLLSFKTCIDAVQINMSSMSRKIFAHSL